MSFEIVAAGRLHFNAGVPEWSGTARGFASAAPVDTGVGIVTLTLTQALDANECVALTTPRGPLAASGLTTCAVSHTSDTVKVVNVWQEGAAGAVSAAADVDFDIMFVKWY